MSIVRPIVSLPIDIRPAMRRGAGRYFHATVSLGVKQLATQSGVPGPLNRTMPRAAPPRADAMAAMVSWRS
jgi:hypothetical protein